MYFKNLDASRFLAFLTIFLGHSIIATDPAVKGSSLYSFYTDHLYIGIIGTDFYTVLSSFLITWIILEEYKFTSKFNLGYFWIRRCLRIWPLYIILILIGTLIVIVSRHAGNNTNSLPSFVWLATFTLNFYIIKHGQAFLYFIVFLWAIAVEEQFYTAWGIILKWFKKLFIPLCLLMIVGSVIFRATALNDGAGLYFNTLNWLGDFAIGSMLAYFCMGGGKWFVKLRNIPKGVIAVVYLVFILNIVLYSYIYSSVFMAVIERLCIASLFAFMLFEQSFSNKHLFELGKWPKLTYLGKISYGLFCYHGLIIVLFEKLIAYFGWMNNSISVFLINPLIIFALTVLVSAISYEYIEKPIMRLRYKMKTA